MRIRNCKLVHVAFAVMFVLPLRRMEVPVGAVTLVWTLLFGS